ncbi:gamma-glutamyltransferase [Acinetobacter sp. ANC 4558]|uniref:gamma-glutamyltransferase family protein n=1 Tax=Acinetobacter sp. ANC 4558 TaxID=1977876 RepID=UPI000A352587|nr:gamma-glutamyltransferase family protein [Acinetobacter sp. ANC 4558]OTG87168.1 gamma-glutamyltransferase [Acinetobacter sp. ANC 4558]
MENKKYIVMVSVASLFVLNGCNDQSNRGGIKVSSQLEVDNNPYSCTAQTSNGSNVVVGSDQQGDPAFPEPASGYRTGIKAQYSDKYMVVANTPLATKAGCDVLKAGGSAVDAAIAVQAVLGLVEPQSSTIAGSAFMVYYDAKTKKVTAYDGRETAPAAATEYYLIRQNQADINSVEPAPNARRSGRSIGVPGVMKMFDLAHKEYGKLAWNQLFKESISLASNGFKVPGRLADAIQGSAPFLKLDKEATQTFFKADGTAYQVGETLKNAAYAASIQKIAQQGVQAMYSGEMANNIVKKAGQTVGDDEARTPMTPSLMTVQDLQNYKAIKREPVCTTYRNQYYVCTMPPPSSGGVAVAQTLGILENFDLATLKPQQMENNGGIPQAAAVHLISEAERLAYADRDKYVADTDFVALPANGIPSLINKDYLKQRAALIQTNKSMGVAQAGNFNISAGKDKTVEFGTTQFTIVDAYGNIASVTSTVESSMGSFHMVDGFLLSNQLTDFSAQPVDSTGLAIANRIQPNKRPRSTMAPTIVFNGTKAGDFFAATGSPGGGTIIQFVVKTLIGMMDWNLDAQQATAMMNFGATNSVMTNIDSSNTTLNLTGLIQNLESKGHIINFGAQTSGVATIMKNAQHQLNAKYVAGVDPRREGLALGDRK